jgi:hypothetical protein
MLPLAGVLFVVVDDDDDEVDVDVFKAMDDFGVDDASSSCSSSVSSSSSSILMSLFALLFSLLLFFLDEKTRDNNLFPAVLIFFL